MNKVFVVTTVVKQEPRGEKEVILGAYTDKEQAQQAAQVSLTTEGGVLCNLIARRIELGYDTEIVERTEGNVTMWGIWTKGAHWHTQTSFWTAAKVEEVEVK